MEKHELSLGPTSLFNNDEASRGSSVIHLLFVRDIPFTLFIIFISAWRHFLHEISTTPTLQMVMKWFRSVAIDILRCISSSTKS